MEPISFRQHILNGIRPDSMPGRNAPFMAQMTNIRCDRFGGRPFDAITQPWSDAYLNGLNTKLWPHPQYFQFKTHGILAFADEVYEVNYNAGTATLLNIKDFSDLATPFGITGTAPWHAIDLYGTWMLFNGTTTLMRIGVSGQVYGTNDVTIKTGCEYRETRAFWGGFDASNCFALADWQTYLAGYDNNAGTDTQDAVADLAGSLGRNSVWWSSWYGADLLWLFSLTYMKYKNLAGTETAGYSESDPFWRHLKRMGQSGSRVMPWQGDIAKVLELGDGVAVYGSTSSDALPGGCAGLTPIDGGIANTFGLRRLAGWPTGLGVFSRSAVGGDPYGHVAISEEGELWRIEPDFTATRTERAGYKEIFSEYIDRDDNIVISLDPARRDFYIADGQECHVLTPNGLCQAPWRPTTVYFHNGERVGVYTDYSDPNTVTMVSQVHTISGDGVARVVERLKHIGKNNASNPVQFALDYRVNEQVEFTRTSFVTADADGEAAFMIPCIEFRWVLKCASKSAVTVDDVQAIIGNGTARLSGWPASSTSPATE